MCWTSKGKPEIKIAEEDIPVWKVVYEVKDIFRRDEYLYSFKRCKSYYNDYIYRKNICEHTPIIFKTLGNLIKGELGFHSYSDELKGMHTLRGINVNRRFGPLMYITLCSYPKELNLKMARFFIPKGARYMKNDIGEILSDAIVFDSFID